MIILGIETSCDETAASLIEADDKNIIVLSNIVSSQIALHSKWGGVVPNLAAREHLKNILPVIETALEKAEKNSADIDLIAVTNGPGLIPALLIGTTTAKALAYFWKKPLIGIHHIEGHIYANFIRDEISAISNSQFLIPKQNPNPKFPILCLVVSGGHTQLILMREHLDYEIIGETLDDAVGEAFDKVARILGLGYPGGPAVAKIADEFSSATIADEFKITLPRPMIKSANFDFSFSGIKTAVLYAVKKNQENLKNKNYISAMCQEFQTAVIDVLIHKAINAAKKYQPKTILLAGGVSANQKLREQLGLAIEKNVPNTNYKIPDIKYSLDNSAMIAVAGYFRWKKNKNKKELEKNWQSLEADASLKL
ncbi:MAG TPA: tRNA (adenosine(37)-N6)-threonylcarbamoyltransferase complex transferase subunit TsaD [Candidatus Moranbacteria bacterium]|nr:tRNA (adenosine(37)-N6)-threonylcarbamoyltransferase complex transferase subunit TsaD [Candidatus Moranbacteria bacterium]HAT74493.1 tRNA (adenosine(37)-N6)-threonylcarbamoyltransferase complex transferase subunit TsaD [Candidatus Moranbacteria bacterium]